MGEVLNEERASHNDLELKTWVGIFQVETFCVGIFREGIFQGEFDGCEFFGWEFSRGNFPKTLCMLG